MLKPPACVGDPKEVDTGGSLSVQHDCTDVCMSWASHLVQIAGVPISLHLLSLTDVSTKEGKREGGGCQCCFTEMPPTGDPVGL